MSGNSDKEVEELPRLINLSTMSEFDDQHFAKGTLILKSFQLWPESSKMGAKPHIRAGAQGPDLAPIFGDSSQSKKLSEIKPQ